MRLAAALLILLCGGCQSALCPDDITVGTAVKDFETAPSGHARDWSLDYVSVQCRWRLKAERVRGE